MRPPDFVPRLSNGLTCCWTTAGAEPFPGLPFASWFFFLLKDTSVGSFSSQSRGAGMGGNTTAWASPHPFTPHTSARWEEQMICRDYSSPSPSCPVKRAVDLEEYALKGNAAWITSWHVRFLTYFLCMHLVLWFLSSHFSIAVQQENLGQLSQNNSHCVPAATWTVLLVFLRSVEMLADVELLPSQSWKVQASNEILTSGSVLLTNTRSDSWPVPEFLKGLLFVHAGLSEI